MSTTQTVHTQFGEVEVETVECDSCGNEIAKDDAKKFTIGEREGYACSHCVDEGPISFPPDKWIFKPAEDMLLSVILFPLMLLFAFIALSSSETARESTATAIGAIIWIVLPLLAYIYFF